MGCHFVDQVSGLGRQSRLIKTNSTSPFLTTHKHQHQHQHQQTRCTFTTSPSSGPSPYHWLTRPRQPPPSPSSSPTPPQTLSSSKTSSPFRTPASYSPPSPPPSSFSLPTPPQPQPPSPLPKLHLLHRPNLPLPHHLRSHRRRHGRPRFGPHHNRPPHLLPLPQLHHPHPPELHPLNYPLPNGLLALPSNKSIILSADSLTGSILRIDTTTNTVTTILQSPQLLGGTVFPLGINGLAARPLFDGYLYFTVSGQGYFGRIKLSNQGYIPSGSQIQVLAQIQDPGWVNAFDDLDFDHTGKSAYIAWQRGRVVKVTQAAWGQQWTQETIVNGTEDVTLKGVTAVKFAKGWSGRKVLFATTGGLEGENDQVGGQVVRIDL
ncbi:hypothetical protein QC764_311260 [Podospora pseudoanserina]|uniref:Uncharacterized protein n=1 Tax=Podospora pseudoanserina TaxID=2609844 RepID=A0ABR0IEG1_9PEZI|nr:hypothetical protein QC764_311260 [Podospora pseudoanserina]